MLAGLRIVRIFRSKFHAEVSASVCQTPRGAFIGPLPARCGVEDAQLKQLRDALNYRARQTRAKSTSVRGISLDSQTKVGAAGRESEDKPIVGSALVPYI
jgi:hypothetical protein